jgi:glyoxylase-like metal-dependent hydrolase (beta-lactamase superfamily II)
MRAGVYITIVCSLAGAALLAQAPAPQRSIIPVTGDLYLARSDSHNTVFYVTPQGIVLGDPISAEFSTWLKGELSMRFPNRPVRFVLHSHHHFDHAAGADVWNDTAEIVAHENFGAERKQAASARPGAAEQYAAVRMPESTFKDRRRITLGGSPVDIIYAGPNHSRDAAVIHFPEARAVFAVDFITVRRRFPGGFAGSAPLADWIASVRLVEDLDFTTMVPGHGDVGTKADVVAYREYLQDLLRTVQAGIKQGQTVEQLQASSALDRYKDWMNFPEGKNQNIASAYASQRAVVSR